MDPATMMQGFFALALTAGGALMARAVKNIDQVLSGMNSKIDAIMAQNNQTAVELGKNSVRLEVAEREIESLKERIAALESERP